MGNHLLRDIQLAIIAIIMITIIFVGFSIANLEGAWFNIIIYGFMMMIFTWYTFYVWNNF